MLAAQARERFSKIHLCVEGPRGFALALLSQGHGWSEQAQSSKHFGPESQKSAEENGPPKEGKRGRKTGKYCFSKAIFEAPNAFKRSVFEASKVVSRLNPHY